MDEVAIFTAALELESVDQQAGYLDQACAGDPKLRHQVEELLGAHRQAGRFLDDAAAAWNAQLPAVDAPPAEAPGAQIGFFKLLEQIGEGGMGLVFMAEQQQPVRRRVALKVLKPGMDTRQVVARFEAERQALALMDHPNIARVFDGGATTSGRPYFVMELVRGVPITEFCDQHRFTPRQRLELFVTVCQAVQHAHQKGIIHRDLKPTNVLVTLHDTVPVPKVIDFGIAKATTQPLTERTLFTHFAQMVGTPLYMSPEQAEMNGLDVDTRSDVYSLGVLLYELLSGTTPFESDKLKKVGPDELRRIIREEEPPMPSQRLSTLDAKIGSTLSEKRGVDRRRLGQVLRGDLDWIVMKALEKDRNRRYESASAFAQDVQRYLNDETVAACPPSTGYRLGKFWKRQRRTLAITGTFATLLVAGTVVSTWQAVLARQAQRAAEDSEGRAATEAAIARAVNDFLLSDVLGQVNAVPESGLVFEIDPHLSMREALDRAAARIAQRFQDQPLVEAALRMSIGEAYKSLHSFPPAIVHLERALVIRQSQLGPDHPDTLGSMASLAHAYLWTGRHQQSIDLRQRILENSTAKLGPDDPATLACRRFVAEAYWFGGQLEKSVQLLRDVLERESAILGPTHAGTLDTMCQLALTYRDTDQLAESMALYEKVYTIRKATLGPEAYAPNAIIGFAEVSQRAGKVDQAERLLRKALEQQKQRKDSLDSRNNLANVLGFLAANMLMQEKYVAAESFARQALAMKQTGETKAHYWECVLGAALLGQKRFAEAEKSLLQGCEGMKQQEAIHPAVRRRIAESRGWIVRLYEETNQQTKAAAWREKLKGLAPGPASAIVN
jgi:serine/threonine protein kinase/tetratricopeptide (TPR) repeat protein